VASQRAVRRPGSLTTSWTSVEPGAGENIFQVTGETASCAADFAQVRELGVSLSTLGERLVAGGRNGVWINKVMKARADSRFELL
jgi:hypothetical protein